MSYEIVLEKTQTCRCGLGTITYRIEENDWFQYRESSETACVACKLEDEALAAKQRAQERKRLQLIKRARSLAIDRYLTGWLGPFRSCSTKAAWMRYTGGRGYPALGTFYKHVKHAGGLMHYLKRCFESDVEHEWTRLKIEDKEIEALLAPADELFDIP